MEEEIGQPKLLHILRPGELPRVPPRRNLNHLVLLPIRGVGFHLLQNLQRACDPSLEFREGGFRVGEGDGFVVAEADGKAFGGVGGALNLFGERVHVGDEAGGEEVFEGGVDGGGVVDGFGEDGGEGFEGADHDWDGECVEGERGHGGG